MTLTLDMRHQWAEPGQYFHNYGEIGGQPWFPLAYICVMGSQCYWPAGYSGQPGGGDGDIWLPLIMKNAS